MKLTYSWWSGYPIDVHLTVTLDFAVASMAYQHLDAISIFFSQTEDILPRVERSEDFWTHKFQSLEMMPFRTRMPGTERDTWMMGMQAEVDIEEGATLIMAEGFWWAKGAAPPSRANMKLAPANLWRKTQFELPPFGVDIKELAHTDIRFFLDTNCPSSLINDYRGITKMPNASLVREPSHTNSLHEPSHV